MQRLRLEIRGAVQGVGFRPFVYRLAHELGLRGFIINDGRGVTIEAEGGRAELKELMARIAKDRPPRAVVHQTESAWLAAVGYQKFEIRQSEEQGSKRAFLLPDVATCPACLAEINDASDRRSRYPFTNCTDCGPRFSIIRALPYDRPNTTMSGFSMCAECQAEYRDPADRRFHAQPNACPRCGPQLALLATDGTRCAEGDQALRDAAGALRAGRIVALKGLGGFHLMVDARDEQAVNRLRERKHRWEKPLALMVASLDRARKICELSPPAQAVLSAAEVPIVLLPRRPDSGVAESVAPKNPRFGVMLPYTPLHHLLMQEIDFPVVATSGNLSDEPICIDNQEALGRLGEIADIFLIHDRPIERHVDDSVVVMVEDYPQLLRRARGYAPLPVPLRRPIPTILAVGPHLKNTVALGLGSEIFISQHIGDLETREATAAHDRVIRDFLRMYQAEPVAIAHDLHPDYLATQWARQFATAEGARLVGVQHHHAHLVACLAENGVEETTLGVTWDGTGYGLDGTVWGGEFLLGDAIELSRVAHLRQFRLPGGEMAVKEPRRSALGLLFELFGEDAAEVARQAIGHAFTEDELRVLLQMVKAKVNAPVTSSAGRLFDAVASLVGMRQKASFEGQAAMELEYVADASVAEAYPLPLASSGPKPWQLDTRPLIEAVLEDMRKGVSVPTIAGRFHLALADAILVVAQRVGKSKVALTGGCFQNRVLTELAAYRLAEAGFEVLLHWQVPPNDGGISLGQVVVAAAQLERA